MATENNEDGNMMGLLNDNTSTTASAPAITSAAQSEPKVAEAAPTQPVETASKVEEVKPNAEAPAKEDKPVDFTDFLSKTGESATKSKTEVKSEVAKPAEAKPSTETTPKTEEPSSTVKERQERDLTGIDDVIKPLFGKMSNEAFNTLKPIVAGVSKLKADLAAKDALIGTLRAGREALPENYNEHPNAFLLTPEFAQTSKNVQTASSLVEHWQEQLSKIEKGEDNITNVSLDKDGNLVNSGEIKVDPTTKSKVIGALVSTQNQLQQQQGKLYSIQTLHQERHNEAKGWINKFESEAFSAFNNPETEAVVKDIIQKMHPAFHNNPLASLAAKSMLAVQKLGSQLKDLQKANPTVAAGANGTVAKPVDVNAVRAAGPVASAMLQQGGAVKGAGEVNFSDFEKLTK